MNVIENKNGTSLDLETIRSEFPVLHQKVNGKDLVYFDNAATTQKPVEVIKAIREYYEKINSNIHRGIHTLAEKATTAFEATRKNIADFINAPSHELVIFTKGTTDSINLVASSYGRKFIKAGDEIIVSAMDHHSNIIPWQMLCEEKGAFLRVIPILDNGELDLHEYEKLLNEKTKIVSVCYVSNALGTINPVSEIIKKAKAAGAVTMIDGAQASSHIVIDVQQLDCDFLCFSGHKIYGPTGIGILYGKREILDSMPPYQGGGEMIRDVSFEKSTYNDLPYKFEAGTPNIADGIAFGNAIDFVKRIGRENIMQHEHELLLYATEKLNAVPEFKAVGTAKNKIGIISFLIDGIHPFDLGMMLDSRGIAIRTGHHCAQPLMHRLGIEGTARISFAVYNTFQEIDVFIESLQEIIRKTKRQ